MLTTLYDNLSNLVFILPNAVILVLLILYLSVVIASIHALIKPLPETWTYYPVRVRTEAAARMLSDRLTPARSTMDPRALRRQQLADATTMSELRPRRGGLPLPGMAGDLDTETDESDNP